MKKDGLARFYDRLTPEERFRLLVEAVARGDAGECRNLDKSCPRFVYEMNDAAHGDRVRASEMVTTLTCLDLAPRLAKLGMLAGFSDVLTALCNTNTWEAHSAYHRGRAMVGGIRGMGDPGTRPTEPRDLDAEDALREITSRMEEESAVFADTVGRLERETRTEIVAMWEAFSEFARAEMGLEPKTLVRAWFGPILPEIQAVEDTLDSTAVDRGKAEEYGSILRQLWRRLVP